MIVNRALAEQVSRAASREAELKAVRMSDARRPNDGGGPVSYRRHNVHHRLGEAAATSSHHKLAAAPPRRSEANWLPSRSGCRSTPCRTCPAATDADTRNAAVCADAGDTPSPST